MKTKQTRAPVTVDAWIDVGGLRREATFTIPQEEWRDASTDGTLEDLVTGHFLDWASTFEITFGWGEGGTSHEIKVRVRRAPEAECPESGVAA